jgi:DNA-directed RNA polymerase specialized sigma24 family protein
MLLRSYRHRLREQDLEDCLSQATLELVAQARAGARWAGTAHLARVLEQRFASRVADRRRAVKGRSPMQAALENALALGGLEGGVGCSVPDRGPGPEELVLLRMELRSLARLARGLSEEQRLVLASQISLQMECSEFCELHGWSPEKYRKVAQRARARLRQLQESEQDQESEQEDPQREGGGAGDAMPRRHESRGGVPLEGCGSEEKTGTHL